MTLFKVFQVFRNGLPFPSSGDALELSNLPKATQCLLTGGALGNQTPRFWLYSQRHKPLSYPFSCTVYPTAKEKMFHTWNCEDLTDAIYCTSTSGRNSSIGEKEWRKCICLVHKPQGKYDEMGWVLQIFVTHKKPSNFSLLASGKTTSRLSYSTFWLNNRRNLEEILSRLGL